MTAKAAFSGVRGLTCSRNHHAHARLPLQPWSACRLLHGTLTLWKFWLAFHAVAITLPSDPAFVPSTMHDIEVRVGPDQPSAALGPSALNALCSYRPNQLAKRGGAVVTIACEPSSVVGRFVTIQMR